MALDRAANLRPAVYVIEGQTKVFFVAIRDISVNEELLYGFDYWPGSIVRQTLSCDRVLNNHFDSPQNVLNALLEVNGVYTLVCKLLSSLNLKNY